MARGFIQPRFDDCTDCRFFSRHRVQPRCLSCRMGEHFEEKVSEMDPTGADFLSMTGYTDDE